MVSRAGLGDSLDVFWRDLWHSLRNPEFWALSTWMEILVRARQSRLGILWLMMPALVYVYGIGSLFAGMRSHGQDTTTFIAHVALGAMVFRTMMSTIVGSAGVFRASAAFIMDGRVRLTDYLLKAIGKSFFDLCMYIPVVAVALYFCPRVDLFGLAVAPLSLLSIYVNGLWIAVVISLAGARIPDLGQLLVNLSMVLFLLTPIIWSSQAMPPGSLRGHLMRLNPFYYYVELIRAPILGEPLDPGVFWFMCVTTVVGILVATIMYRRYARFVPLWI